MNEMLLMSVCLALYAKMLKVNRQQNIGTDGHIDICPGTYIGKLV